MLTIAEPAEDPTLISLETLRVAAGYASNDDSHDEELETLASRVTAEIAAACNIAIGQSDTQAPPTLRTEGLIETFRRSRTNVLVLSRRHNVAITGIVVDDEDPLVVGDFEVDPESGLLRRLDDGRFCAWRGELVTIAYTAGFDTIPADLDAAAGDLARIRISAATRDPLVKGESTDVPDVLSERVDYWVGAIPGSGDAAIPNDILARLTRYRNAVIV